MNKKIFVFIGIICVFSFSVIFGQEKVSQVNDILSDPSKFLKEDIQVTGLVIQYVEGTEKTTSYYYLKDDFGAIIKVHTAEGKPETNVKYNVDGILYIDPVTELPFISERSKSRADVDIIKPPLHIPTWWEKNWLLVVIIASAVLLFSLILLLFGRKRNTEPDAIKPIDNIQDINFEKNEPPILKDNLKTMVIPSTAPRTMKFIPGEFEVITGDDKGRIIKIGGYPTEDGSIVTIGREEVTGQRDFAHIQLKEKTISRRQAEIILKDGKMYIKNLSQTNYTKLDGKEIPPNTSSELNSGSVITFGEVEMKYNIK
jgi:pSer/pThr/pTyr-binding forkhead associated (FHA) protein